MVRRIQAGNLSVLLTSNLRQVAVEVVETGEVFTDEADIVISARGTLNDISWPQVPGLSDLTIPVMHSAAWNNRSVRMRI
jgi:cation diffusion facilitator CzcD-associated flavoprotein CzcO